MTDNNLILPVLLHLIFAVFLIFFRNRTGVQRVVSLTGNIVALMFAIKLFTKVKQNGILTMQAGKWEAPYGITFVADMFSSTLVLLTAIAGLAVAIFSQAGISRVRVRFSYFPIFHLLLMGLNGSFLTGDIFNLYVWFEIIIIASFVLMTLGGEKPQIEGAIKYVTMNLLASVIFLTAIAILYGLTGSLNMADLSLKVSQVSNRGLINVTAMLFFIGFGIKAAVFPMYFWLPSSYHTPPSAIAAIFGGLLTKAGVYALLRVFTLIFIPDNFMMNVMCGVAVMTLITGALGALIQQNLRRILSYFIVCHIGYMVAGLSLFTEMALTGAIFYLIHDIIIKTNVFMVSGIIKKINGNVQLKQIGGLYKHYPWISFIIAIVLFSLTGIPPLSGFWPKIFLFEAAFDTRSYILVGALLIAGFITMYVVAKIWIEAFWKEKKDAINGDFHELPLQHKISLVAPVVMLAAVSLYIGFAAEPVISLAKQIAGEMLDTSAYVMAVLGQNN